MLRSLRTVALAGAATVAGAALALGALDTKSAKAEGGTLVWSIPAAMSLMDPPQSCGWLTKNATHMIFDGLVELELGKPEAGWATLRPALAESWTVSEDGRTYTFNLRQGVNFHDGTPFNAEVAKWNYDRFSDPDVPQYSPVGAAFLSFYARWIESTRVVDEHTFEVTLTQPHYEWLQIGQSSCGQPEMISPAAWEKYGDEDIAINPIGTGPFKFVEREIDVMVVLERNDDYYGEPAKLDRMIYRQITDPATRIAALRAGEINMVTEPTWDEIENLVDEGFQLLLQPNVPSVWYAAFNMKHEALQDVRVRKAINMAIDREGVAREVLRGTGKAEHGMLSAGTFAYDPDYKCLPVRSGGRQGAVGRGRLRGRAGAHLRDLRLWLERSLGEVDPARPQEGRHRSQVGQAGVDDLSRQVAPGHAGGRGDEQHGLGLVGALLDGPCHALRSSSAERHQWRLVLQREGRCALSAGDPDRGSG